MPERKPTYEELERRLHFIRQDRKMTNWIFSILTFIVVFIAFHSIAWLAAQGMTSVAVQLQLSETSSVMASTLLFAGTVLIYFYIIWHLLTSAIILFQDELNIASDEFAIIVRGIIHGSFQGIRKERENWIKKMQDANNGAVESAPVITYPELKQDDEPVKPDMKVD